MFVGEHFDCQGVIKFSFIQVSFIYNYTTIYIYTFIYHYKYIYYYRRQIDISFFRLSFMLSFMFITIPCPFFQYFCTQETNLMVKHLYSYILLYSFKWNHTKSLPKAYFNTISGCCVSRLL